MKDDHFQLKYKRFPLYIILLLTVLILANFCFILYLRWRDEQAFFYQEARALTELFNSIQLFIAGKQDLINQSPDGSFHFKGLNPEAVGMGISSIINQRSDHRLKMVNFQTRNPASRPDAVETEALQIMMGNPTRTEFFKSARDEGKKYYYFIKRLNVTAGCLQCHGGPKGQLDITGHPKEGWRAGDFGGAISLRLPSQSNFANLPRDDLIPFIISLALAGFSIFLVATMLQKISHLSSDLLETHTTLEQRHNQLYQLERLKDELFHMLIHDMKDPLTFMLGSLQMLQEKKTGPLNSQQEDLIRLTQRGGERLINMVSNLLDINRMEEGKLTLNYEEVQLSHLLSDQEITWGQVAVRQEKTFRIFSLSLIKIIFCDKTFLERILENLLSNAFKHTPVRTGQITLSVEDNSDPPGILFKVSDNGRGILQNDQPLIFEKFWTKTSDQNHTVADTGLGLSFCKMAVEALGGTIAYQTGTDGGSIFSFIIPTKIVDPE